MGKGGTTSSIAGQLHISRTTVDNHVQHILRKLDSHTRLEAIRRAEHAGFLRLGAGIARKGWLEKKDVINTLPLDKLRVELQRKRKR